MKSRPTLFIRDHFLPVLVGVLFIALAIYVASQQIVWQYVAHFDKFLHLTGGVIAAWLVIGFFTRKLNKNSKLRKFLLVLLWVLVIGIVWEIAEHLSGYYGPTYWPIAARYFYGGDLIDTIGDVIADLSGGSIFTIIYLLIS